MKLMTVVGVVAMGMATSAQAAQWDFAAECSRLIRQKGQISESKRFSAAANAYWKHLMTEYPEWATYVGYPGRDDRWTDYSKGAIERRKKVLESADKLVRSFDRSKLKAEERTSLDLLKHEIGEGLDARKFPGELMPITQMGGVHQEIPQMMEAMPAQSVAHYRNMIARLNAVPVLVEQITALLKEGLKAGVTPPKVTLREIPNQVQNLLTDDPFKSAVLGPFNRMPSDISDADQKKLKDEASKAYTGKVAPALKGLKEYLAETYVPGARESIAWSALPNGAEWYAFQARKHTTTSLSPQQIHDIGQAEVKRIRGEMDKIIESVKFSGGFKKFLDHLRTDSKFYFDKPEDLLREYRDIAKRADPELTKLFGRLPRLPYGIKPVPSYAEKSQTTAYYEGGSPESGRPGYFFANTYNLKARPKWEMEALTLHEAVPGHHLQIALAQETDGLPEFRKHGGHTAYIEGWGLYSESLGEEMGFYKDPYSKFGQLTYEMWRAIRLVVDTGMHRLGWTRQQAVDFFLENSGKTEHDVGVEVDRYIVWAGQALAYKIGQLKIKELRERAKSRLGEKFDIRKFHDVVLGSGSLPLSTLETKVEEWVSGQPARTTGYPVPF